MAVALECPKCGAPLKLEPHPGDLSTICPYCQETIVIPDNLRVRPPKVVLPREEPARQGTPKWIYILAAIVVIYAIARIIGYFEIKSASELVANTTRSIADTPTPDLVSTVTSGTATAEAIPTLEALRTLVKTEQAWPASFTEPFADNSNQWLTGDVRDDYVSGNRSIGDGVYTWKLTSVQGASDFAFPTMPDQKDFYASVDVRLMSMPDDPDSDAGMVFRYNSDTHSWYYFSINNDQHYYFGWYNGSEWATLIPQTYSSAIHNGETNHLAIGAHGSQFVFIINGQMVDHFINDKLPSGGVGVGLSLAQAGQKATIEFANFKVLTPQAAP